jgi:hypothetical protein
MDLRSLIAKMDDIEQNSLLSEAEDLMEKVRIRYSDVEAVANQYKDNEEARAQALAKLARDNGLPGLFDPIKKELVKLDGTYAWFAGASEETVQRLRKWGLLPDSAKTSSWVGLRGEDEKTAQSGNTQARSRDQMVDKAEELMKKAVQFTNAPIAKEGRVSIANSLMEDFGYIKKALLEDITPKEHEELKGLIKNLTPYAKPPESDPDAIDLISQYRSYIEKRDALIARIRELITKLKEKLKPAVVAKESLQESKRRMIAEGRIQVLEEGKRYLRDGVEWTYNPTTKLYSTILESGEVVQLDEEGFVQGASDFGRGLASGATFGYADNAVAAAKALVKGTKYADELKRELAATDAVRKRSPILYGAGDILGTFAIPGAAGLKLGGQLALGAARYASDTFVRDPLNKSTVAGATPRKGDGPQPAKNTQIQAMQNEILKLDPKALPRFGADGKMGKETQTALAKYPDIAKKYASVASAPAVAPADQGGGPMQPAPAGAGEPALTQEQVSAVLTQMGIKPGSKITAEQAVKIAQALGLKPEANIAKSAAPVNESSLASLIAKMDAIESLDKDEQLNEMFLFRVLADMVPELIAKGMSKEVINLARTQITRGMTAGEQASIKAAQRTARDLMAKPAVAGAERAAVSGAERAAVSGAERAAVGAVDDVAVVAAKGSESVIAKLTSKFGPKAEAALAKVRAWGSKIGPWLMNHKFLTLVAILGALGYILNDDYDPREDPPGPVVPPHRPDVVEPQPVTPVVPPKPEDDPQVKLDLEELKKLLAQLNGGWPTDTETAEMNKLAQEVNVKPEGREGGAAQPVTATGNDAVKAAMRPGQSAQSQWDALKNNPAQSSATPR